MSRKRKPKQGYVYLLKDDNDYQGKTYKFGCTTLTPEKRCKRVNIEKKEYGYNFRVIASFKSFDIYSDEHKVRCEILNSGAGMLSEIFNTCLDDQLNFEADVVKRFLFIGGVLTKETMI